MALVGLREAIAQHVRDGQTLALEGITHLIPFAAGHEIIRQGRRDLHLVRMTPDLVYDQMIGAGCARALTFLGRKSGRRLATACATPSSVLLSSPIPVSYLVSLLFSKLYGAQGTVYATVFEGIYILAIMAASVIIVRNAKDRELKERTSKSKKKK